MTLTLTPRGPMMLAVRASRDPAWKTTTLGPVVQDYLLYLADRRVSPQTITLREGVLARMCRQLDGLPLQSMEGKQGRQVLNERLVRGEWADVQDSSLNTYINILKAFWSWAYDEELVLHDPARRIDRPKTTRREYSLFTPEEEGRLVKFQPFMRDRVGLMLHFEFAMRATDLRLLQLSDIDLDRQAVRLKNGKGGTDKTLSFRTPAVFDATRTYLTLDRRGLPNEYLIYPMKAFRAGRYEPGLWVPVESRGGGEPYREPIGDGYWTEHKDVGRTDPFSPSGLRAWWRRCLKRSGVEWRPFHHRMHDARHTTATRLVGSGKNFRTVSKFLRHENTNTTDLYVHLNEVEAMRDELWGGE